MNIRERIQQAIAGAAPDLGLRAEDVFLEHPADFAMGDYSTNVAMASAKRLGTSPRPLAERIAAALGAIEGVERCEVAGPGFINFHLSKRFFNDSIADIAGNPDFGRSDSLKGRKMLVEYTDPNPFKQFHIGHLMSNAIGESLSRVFEFRGAEVRRANYQGDVGLHVAKAIWGMRKTIGEKPGDDAGLSAKTAYLGAAYVLGSNSYEDDTVAKSEIDELNRAIFLKEDDDANRLYEWGRDVSLRHFEEIYAKLGTKFDFYFFESEVAKRGIEIVAGNVPAVFEESDGATVFRGENHGLHTRVFLNSKGLPTYEAKELALAERKRDAYPFDESVTITANEQSEYFKVVLKALELIDPGLRAKMRHVAHGMLRFASGKMSSRKGNVITGESMIASVEEMVLEKTKDRELAEAEREGISEAVGVAAIKYSILKQTPGRDIVFDFEKSLSFEGDSGPYLQYAAVRALSVLDKAEAAGVRPDASASQDGVAELERMLYRFPEVVEKAHADLAPSHIVTYLIEISSAFNSYYAGHQIVNDGPEFPYRVALTRAFVTVMKNGLHLLGIRVPAKM